MFDRFYSFVNIGKTPFNPYVDEPGFECTLHYKFRTEHTTYLVEIRRYVNSLYIVEFYLRTDKNNKKYSKYGKLTDEGRAPQIVRTCFNIMLKILKSDQKANFAFIGSPTFHNDEQVESIETTRRFKIYRYVSINLLGEASFEQFGDTKTSCYLIANNLVDKLQIKKQASNILKSLF